MGKVSAIISSYNSEKFIRGCLDDLIAQSLYRQGGLEIVAIVSGSQQGEEAIIRDYQTKHKNIVLKVTERESMYQAWNRAIEIATGEYITNANTDDRHAPDALERLSRELDSNPGVSLTYGDIYLTNIENETYAQNSKLRIYRYPQFFPPAAVLHYQFGPQSMWRKSVHQTIGMFNPNMKCAGDYDFNLRFALKFLAKHIEGPPTGLYLEHASALSFKDDQMRRETDALMREYRTEEKIEEFYRQVGATADTPQAKAQIFSDFGIRALLYYPPWFMGNPHRDAELARQCFELAVKIGAPYPDALNNLGVLRAELGDVISGLVSIREAGDLKPTDADIAHNIQELTDIARGTKTQGALRYIHSELPYPSQMILAGLTPPA